MTYKNPFFAQGDPGIVSESTIERKKMSTKTIYKRIALVAVAAMGAGLLSVAPANAAINTDVATTKVTSITLVTATAAPTQNTAVVVNLGAATVATAAVGAGTDYEMEFQAYLESYPAGGSTSVAAVATATGTTTVVTGGTNAIAGAVLRIDGADNAALGGNTVAASTTLGIGSFSFTPSKSGTYVVKVWHDADGDSVVDVAETQNNVSITVALLAGLSPSLSTAYMAAAETAAAGTTLVSTAYTAVTTLIQRAAYKTSGTAIAEIEVILVDSDGTTASAGHTVSCQVTGAGFCEVGDAVAEEATTGVTLRSDSLALAANQGYITIVSDGTTGPGSVEVKVTDAVTGAVSTLATRTYYSFGDVTKLEVKQILKIGRAAGGVVGYNGATRSATNVAATVIKATDALGQAADITAAGVPTLVPTTITSITGGACTKDDGSSLVYSPGVGFGYYNCSLTTPVSALSGGSSVVTARIVSPADATTYITTTFTNTVGGSVATETLAFDKASYAPGEAMVITRTAKDSANNPVYDGALSPAVTFSKAVGGTAPVLGAYVGGVSFSSTSAATSTLFAPVSAGSFNAIAVSGNATASTITASSSVADANAALLTLVNSLIAKINALNKLVIKIQKKVRA